MNIQLESFKSLEGLELEDKKIETLKQINDTADKAYKSAVIVGLQTVRSALDKSSLDGDKKDHPLALEKLKDLSNRYLDE